MALPTVTAPMPCRGVGMSATRRQAFVVGSYSSLCGKTPGASPPNAQSLPPVGGVSSPPPQGRHVGERLPRVGRRDIGLERRKVARRSPTNDVDAIADHRGGEMLAR